jgi:hypothetical protein
MTSRPLRRPPVSQLPAPGLPWHPPLLRPPCPPSTSVHDSHHRTRPRPRCPRRHLCHPMGVLPPLLRSRAGLVLGSGHQCANRIGNPTTKPTTKTIGSLRSNNRQSGSNTQSRIFRHYFWLLQEITIAVEYSRKRIRRYLSSRTTLAANVPRLEPSSLTPSATPG